MIYSRKIIVSAETWDKMVEVFTTKECRRAEDKRDITIEYQIEDATGIGNNIYLVIDGRKHDITDYGNW